MKIHYLEIVSDDVDTTCVIYQNIYGVSFSDPDPMLGNARTAAMKNGGMIGVRLPMSDTEQSVVRPYCLVDDIEHELQKALDAGAEAAHPPLEIPGLGMFAIYILSGNQLGLWQK